MATVARAVSDGADVIGLDVQRSADRKLVARLTKDWTFPDAFTRDVLQTIESAIMPVAGS